ncbi:MAG: NUDIX domain-containing protein [Candidatus Pacebacteria bacterium]|nr:NUDIX domain-containing protein [Candidatus Paceibacterota bacterium]
MTTATPKIGLFGGIFNKDGKLLVKKREQDESLPGEWDLPGGAVEADANAAAIDERIVSEELLREVEEETGIQVAPFQRMPAMYPAVNKGGSDWAFGIIVGVTSLSPTKGNWRFVSPRELGILARFPEGKRLVSGYGKRMHRLCLRMLASRDCPNPEYRAQAGEMLQKIQQADSNA